jgi:hypothetical protein
MARRTPVVLEAPRLPALCRLVCRYAGIPASFPPGSEEWFVLRSGGEPPDFFAKLLEEAVLDDEAEAEVYRSPGAPDGRLPGPGQVTVQSGFVSPCPVDEQLRRAVRADGGRMLVFAVERRDAGGRLLGVTWVGLPEEEPPPEAPFRAAVVRAPCSKDAARAEPNLQGNPAGGHTSSTPSPRPREEYP